MKVFSFGVLSRFLVVYIFLKLHIYIGTTNYLRLNNFFHKKY